MTRYKCSNCKVVFEAEEPLCPLCNTSDAVKVMCPRDHCNCPHGVVESIAYCPECGEPMCPECGCHSVVQISRVTGYLSSVDGWNNAKKQELKDRVRYNTETNK
ncbi:MAG: anaerobic ribonucleoside triphosphate reductase [Deltaproteobacteria bacterium ADurb.Bin135]|nr:MAG: anaerobic ribonucleoside triphosphate reductase [Deltaproteobacteria bacterium ADurb.Bin135]